MSLRSCAGRSHGWTRHFDHHGARDHTADPKSAAYLYENVASSRREKVILPDAGHLLPLDIGIRERVFERTAAFLSEDTAR